MTEVLFVLTVIFVAYVFYVVAHEKKTTIKSIMPVTEPEKPTIPQESASTNTISEKEQPKTTKVETSEVVKTKSAPTKQNAPKKGLKNPKTGEIASTYSNYIFTKRWIKEALVAEGLLEKVYKNNELNTETEAAIKTAITKLEAMDQYKV